MAIDRAEAQIAEPHEPVTRMTAATSEAYSGHNWSILKTGTTSGAVGGVIDFGAHDIYSSKATDTAAKAQESHEDARPTPLAYRARMERLEENKDLDQSAARTEKEDNGKQASKTEADKSQESNDGAQPTALAERQRMQRLAQNKDVDQAGAPADKSPDNSKGALPTEKESQQSSDGARPTPLAILQRQERLAQNADVQQSGH